MLSKEDLVKLALQLTQENALEAFKILGGPQPQKAQLGIYIKAKLFPVYEKATEEERKKVEELLVASEGAPKAVVKPEPEPEPAPIRDEKSPLNVYDNLLEGGELDFNTLDFKRINEQFEYKGEKFTLIMALAKYILSRGKPYTWKDLEILLSRTKVDFNVIVDGRTVEDVILSTDTDGLTQENIKNISTLISILLLNGFKFTRLQDTHGPMKELINKIPVFKKLYLPPVPSSACQYAQNWQTGDFNGLKLPEHIKPDYFYCGQYYFDGRYVVVKFPKGMSLYHGSRPLANAAVNLPLGKEYYTPSEFQGANPYPEINLEEAGNSRFSIEELLTEKSPFTQSWFADPENAKKYSDGCCVQSYKLKHDSVFILLDNELNIENILGSPDIDKEAKKNLLKMFDMPEDSLDKIEYELGKSNNPFGIIGNIKYKRNMAKTFEKARASAFDIDKAFAAWFCNHFNESGYAGYCAPHQFAKTGFHLEFMYCNSALYLERDLTNPVDIFYEDASLYPEKVRLLMNQMRYYETTNTDFHSGNLLQHSVWTLLFTESLLGQLVDLNNPDVIALNDRTRSIIIAAGLLHDIGKMNPDKCVKNTKRNKFIYYDILTHPEDGAEYFDTGIPILNDDLEIVERMSPRDILLEMIPDITLEEVKLVQDVVALHWFFGKEVVGSKKLPLRKYREAIAGYKQKFGNVLTMIATMIVSISDIEASQPFTLDKLASLQPGEIKDAIRSKVFKYIVSKPKLYRGGNIASKIKINKNGIECMNDVLKS